MSTAEMMVRANHTLTADSWFGLDGLLKPLARSEFLARFYEAQPCHVRGDAPAKFLTLLTLADVDQIIATRQLRARDCRVVQFDEPIAQADYVRRRDKRSAAIVDPRRVLEHYQNGATIILEALDRSWGPLGRLCRALEEEHLGRFQTNVYVTPRSQQGFGPHYDAHDVFILQVHGSKRWRVSRNAVLDLPFSDERNLGTAVVGPDAQDLELREGDLLYIPRGFAHEAIANQASIHVTLGCVPYTVADAVRSLLQEASTVDRGIRESFRDVGQVEAALASMSKRLDGPMSEKLSEEHRAGVRRRRPDVEGFLYEISEGSGGVNSNTEVTFLGGELHGGLNLQADELSLRTRRGELRFPRKVESALRFMLAAGGQSFLVAEIPTVIDEAGILVLVRRLIREGLVRTNRGS